jgi:hypothetical protein
MRWLSVAAAMMLTSCAPALRQPTTSNARPPIDQLWQEPQNIAARDLFYGPGRAADAPNPRGRWEYVDIDLAGASRGYDVRDERGRKWSVKMGVEAPSEIVASRLLWAIGYHQPPTYYVPAGWRVAGRIPDHVLNADGPQGPARFRPKLPEEIDHREEWSWYDNPFIGARAFRGLVVANLLLNNWDFKASNNRIYGGNGASNGTPRYVVRDLGASLGADKTPFLFRWLHIRWYRGSKNDIDDFEESEFIRRVEGTQVEFAHAGFDKGLTKGITPDDVRWTCGLFARLTEAQLDAAFRAANYSPAVRKRYIRKLQQKIEEGLRL